VDVISSFCVYVSYIPYVSAFFVEKCVDISEQYVVVRKILKNARGRELSASFNTVDITGINNCTGTILLMLWCHYFEFFIVPRALPVSTTVLVLRIRC